MKKFCEKRGEVDGARALRACGVRRSMPDGAKEEGRPGITELAGGVSYGFLVETAQDLHRTRQEVSGMISPIDAINYTMAHVSKIPDEAHYYLASLPLQDNRPLMDQANFHLVDRNISMSQIGFDYYYNIVT